MATLVFTDGDVVLSGSNVSDHLKSVTLNVEAEGLDDTVMGDTFRSMKPGLKNWSLELELLQDFASSNIDGILFPLLGTTFSTVTKPTSAAVGVNNPTFTGTGTLLNYNPIQNTIGELATTSVTIQSAGTLVRAEA